MKLAEDARLHMCSAAGVNVKLIKVLTTICRCKVNMVNQAMAATVCRGNKLLSAAGSHKNTRTLTKNEG